ncbi:MAG: APC family permease [Chloroflexi bacterium]|nr:APC family permease [Chloroflexota bacterium]
MAAAGEIDDASASLPESDHTNEGAEAASRHSQSAGQQPFKTNIFRQEVIKGSHPGDRYVRYGRNIGPFKRKSGGVLAASLATEQPRSRFGRAFNRVKQVMIGRPLSTEQSIHERLTNVKALAVLSSDALSSVAYATEEILRILIVAGVGAFSLALPLGAGIIALLAIVVTSYRQTIAAYPRGGGSYIVAKDNLGTLPGLAAAASILIGYTLTVAVSISAGVAALYSLFPAIEPYKVELCVVLVVLITIANLRGLREAGNIFAVPTYLFIAGMLVLVVFGLMRVFLGVGGPIQYVPPTGTLALGTEGVTILLLLRAFTQGSAALTGVEAIADGVPAFKAPEARNARTTLLWMGGLSIVMFGGITYLATHLQIKPSDAETVVSQIARSVFPPIFGLNPLWYFIQVVTALILVLAANTAFSDFPRLSYFLARDKFMPHQYAFRGDRLAYSFGIVTLAVLASVLIIGFNGDTTALIPLYAIGVFSAFTFSQGGMVARWWRTRTSGWQRNLAVNLLGALTTFGVFVISSVTKFQYGTWIVLLLIPLIMAMFLAINRHYRRVESEVATLTPLHVASYKHKFIVPIADLSAMARRALAYAGSLHADVIAVHVAGDDDPNEVDRFVEEWRKSAFYGEMQLVILESTTYDLVNPLLRYIDRLDREADDDTMTIVLPEFIPRNLGEYLLHNQTALRLKLALLRRSNTVVANVPYTLGGSRGRSRAADRLAVAQRLWVPVAALLALLLLIYNLFLS